MTIVGITWDHPRGRAALEAAADRARADPEGVDIQWHAHSLEHFESHPIAELAERYDLLVLDHPHLGEALASDSLRPLDELMGRALLASWARASVGPTFASYSLEGRQWALPLDAATQVAAYRAAAIDSAPVTWGDVVAAAPRLRVALCLAGPHAFLTFASVCVALGEEPAAEPGRLVSAETATAALETLREIAGRAPEGTSALNPIRMLERMSIEADIDYVPLVYGYVNYSMPGLRFADAPRSTVDGRPGSTLGGTGLAISRRCEVTPALLGHLEWLMSDDMQRRFIPVHSGQPSRRAAWEDPLVDAAAHAFYSGTLATVEGSWVRPRYDGYIAFQGKASALVRSALEGEQTVAATVAALDAAYEASTIPRVSAR